MIKESYSQDLTARQAAACENAKTPASKCKCRCGGVCHGKNRGSVRELSADDPHFPTDEDPKERKRREREETQRKRTEALMALYSSTPKSEE